jgi:flagellin
MALNIISNFAANVAHRNLARTDMQATASLAKLSAGTRVLSAKDDAASLAVGSRLRAEVESLKQANVNTGQASSMLQIAEGAMATALDILVRMKSLATQAASDQLGTTERAVLNSEFTALRSEIDRIANDTEFNGIKLTQGGVSGSETAAGTGAGHGFTVLEGVESISASAIAAGASTAASYVAATNIFSMTFGGVTYTGQIDATALTGGAGANPLATSTVVVLTNSSPTENGAVTIQLNTAFDSATDSYATTDSVITLTGTAGTTVGFKVGTGTVTTEDDLSFTIDSITTTTLGVSASIISGATSSNANAAMGAVTSAIDTLNQSRATVGASQNRLEFASANLASSIENAEAARSTLLDLDIASEISNFTSKQVLLQAGVAMLAQANQVPQNLLRLLQ